MSRALFRRAIATATSGSTRNSPCPIWRVEGDDFTGCVDGNLLSWVAPIDVAEGEGGAFHGYNAEPIEEFWILDVDGTRLVIEANWSPASAQEDLNEMRAILDSIRIEP